jgi:hypothetical protein
MVIAADQNALNPNIALTNNVRNPWPATARNATSASGAKSARRLVSFRYAWASETSMSVGIGESRSQKNGAIVIFLPPK